MEVEVVVQVVVEVVVEVGVEVVAVGAEAVACISSI